MRFRLWAAALLGITLITTGCSKKQPPVVQPTAPAGGGGATTQPVTPPPPPSGGNDAGAALPTGPTTAELRNVMADRVHFDFDRADILSQDAALLDRKAAILRANPTIRIRIVGHCDERGSDAYNVALGMKRAASAKDYLVRAGIDASRIEIASLGREAPLDHGHDENAWRLNRRGEFEVTAGPSTWVAPQ